MKKERRKQQSKQYLRCALALLFASLLLTGCGSSDKAMSEATVEMYDYDGGKGVQNMAAGAATDELYESESWTEEAAEEEIAEDNSASGEGAADLENSVASNRKLIKRVNMTAETQEFDSLIAKIEQKVTALGGYMENANIYGNSYNYDNLRSAHFTARVPVDRLDELVTSVGENSNVTNKSESATDVTLSYVDTKSRKEALEVEYERLMTLLEKAEDIDTIVALETRLTDVRYEIQNLESTLRTYDNLVDYATVDISVEEVKVYTPEVTQPQTVWEKMSEGFLRSVRNIGYDLQDFVISLVINLPYLIIWAVIIAVIVLIIRAIRKRHKRKKAAKKQTAESIKKEEIISLDETESKNGEDKADKEDQKA